LVAKFGCSLATAYHAVRTVLGTCRPREVGSCHHTYFDAIDAPEKAYWLGFLTADGCVYRNTDKWRTKNTVSLSLSERDLDHLSVFRSHLGCKNTITKVKLGRGYANAKQAYQVAFSSPHMVERLISLGVTPRKSLTLSPPQKGTIPDYLRKDYFRGLVDGDGYISLGVHDGRRQYKVGLVGSLPIVDAFREYCVRLTGCRSRIRPHYSIFQFGTSDKFARSVITELYRRATVYLPRKYERAVAATNNFGQGGSA
jgi:hypothetical protein